MQNQKAMKTKKNVILIISILTIFTFINSCKKDGVAIVETNSVSSITKNSAKYSGKITSDGNSEIIERGFCWSENNNPTIENNKIIEGSGDGEFSILMNGFYPNRTFYVRAYAINETGIGYGNIVSFTTTFAFELGAYYHGGIIIYILKPGEAGYDPDTPHGLIVAKNDFDIVYSWNNGTNIEISNTHNTYGSGKSNTAKILTKQGIGSYAAKICDQLVVDGYDDWFLPSRDELAIVFYNRKIIGNWVEKYTDHWTSSEHDKSSARTIVSPSGSLERDYKNARHNVRATSYF